MEIIPTHVWIPETSLLVVSVSSDNKFNLVHTDDSKITLEYELLKQGDTVVPKEGGIVAEFTSESKETVYLSAEITSTFRYIGKYTDTLNFFVEIQKDTV